MLRFCDYLGEKLAWGLGITSPKYFYELEEYKRSKQRDEERKAKMEEQMKGWREGQGQGQPVESGLEGQGNDIKLQSNLDFYVFLGQQQVQSKIEIKFYC